MEDKIYKCNNVEEFKYIENYIYENGYEWGKIYNDEPNSYPVVVFQFYEKLFKWMSLDFYLKYFEILDTDDITETKQLIRKNKLNKLYK